ncbi:hypothetical protein BCIN_12g00790 [Botrytis cinerea B05.10]|uniref:Uncharacterized protein n=1 Tax=Botryotinia fuckeliana (strain B05.10) TaxID=332648 RepID=A0A384JY17_BOTFB|nr:hypothetical protein BCIN_12g00790 [Botrytis cinerea B05.10]ATZ55485.1 hypothetical protein BCIN_12g00790 [Botrytis cinerea B05.10]
MTGDDLPRESDLKVILDDKLAMSLQMRITKNRLRTITTQVKLHMSPEALSSLGPLLVLQHMMNGALAPDKYLSLCLVAGLRENIRGLIVEGFIGGNL